MSTFTSHLDFRVYAVTEVEPFDVLSRKVTLFAEEGDARDYVRLFGGTIAPVEVRRQGIAPDRKGVPHVTIR